MAYRRARPGQAQALPGLQARARLDPREFGQAGPGFTEAWPAWPVGNTDHDARSRTHAALLAYQHRFNCKPKYRLMVLVLNSESYTVSNSCLLTLIRIRRRRGRQNPEDSVAECVGK